VTDDEIAEFFARSSQAGEVVRQAWLDEFIRHPDGKQYLRELIEDADGDLAAVLATLLHDFADAPRRGQARSVKAKKPREESWKQALADHLNRLTRRDSGPLNREQRFERIPESNDQAWELPVGEHEFAIYRDEKFAYAKNLNIQGSREEKIAFSTLVDWMKRPRTP